MTRSSRLRSVHTRCPCATPAATAALLVAVLAMLLVVTPPALARDYWEAIAWADSFADAKTQARSEGKFVMVFFYEDDDRDCEKMLKELADDDVAERLAAKYVCARYEANDPAGNALRRQHQISTYPQTWFFLSDGRPLKAMVGRIASKTIEKNLDELESRFESGSGDGDNDSASGNNAHDPGTMTNPYPRDRVPAARSAPLPASLEGALGPGSPWRTVVDAGLSWLAEKQRRDGYWDRRRVRPDDPRYESSLDNINVAVSATAGIALLAHGHTLTEGEYKTEVKRARKWLIETVREDGIVSEQSGSLDLHHLYAYFQTPLAGWFLAECALLDADDELVRAALEKVAKGIADGQGSDGGWGYGLNWRTHPRNTEFGWTILTTTALNVFALSMIERAGVDVSKAAIDKGLAYMLSCQTREGGFMYRPGYQIPYPEATAMAWVAASVAGVADDDKWHNAARYLRQHMHQFGTAQGGKYESFGRMVIGVAMARHGVLGGEAWMRSAFDWLYSDQTEVDDDGEAFWEDPLDRGDRIWATACNLIALAAAGGANRETTYRPAALTPIDAPAVKLSADDDVKYEQPRHDKSCIKLIELSSRERGDTMLRYAFDLIVTIERDQGDGYVNGILDTLRRLPPRFYDMLDGQAYIRRIDVYRAGQRLDEADLRFTSLQFGGVDGFTHLGREIINGVEQQTAGEYVEFPYRLNVPGTRLESGGGWETPYGTRTILHELGHYLFSLPDEYSLGTGEPLCAHSIMAGTSPGDEMCNRGNNTDRRGARQYAGLSCWEIANKLYRKLTPPTGNVVDPGPWRAPPCEIELHR